MEEQTSTILVVDDNELNRDLLSRRLARKGHTVHVAEHGRQALSMIAESAYDLVLLDIMMPEMNGYEVLERLKADPAVRHIPVIMITAVDDQESIVRCIRLGAEDHLPKPFDPAILQARVASSLAKKLLHDREQLYAASLTRELEIGRQIQAGFLPEQLPEPAGWDLAACFRPARQVAGDFYDAFTLPGGSVALIVADVCDKGVGAALFMALFRSLLRALAEQRYVAAEAAHAAPGEALLATVVATNDYIARTHASANMFATVFFGELNPATGRLLYVNGGHEPPLLIGGGGALRERLEPTGPALGMMPGLPFGTGATTVEPGDLMLVFTDGILDARAPTGSTFGEERVLACCTRGAPAEVLAQIERELDAHAAGEPAFDDVTMLALRRAAS